MSDPLDAGANVDVQDSNGRTPLFMASEGHIDSVRVLLEAGDPATEADKLKDRSPLSHVDLLQAPILLIHGENDSRVPVAESRQFAAACEAAGKDCVYLEFTGMGHHIKGVENLVRQYQATFDLIRRATAE